ncbi:recombinase family protein [Kribbella sandramycini]|uniref:DNA invertase Pin-like site-specific DNA recombinase n=1 Tax=Kribbella sandramycini TaxID=60450 RepID=A0A7Y4P476_9ACTN|nr:recombinase family protein [Kribbella sandramycini]MBB6564379.1 DNA invertase Pin-like site-specific DNA recombinase [Kribbella sandramycini]NOL45843.1 recombinase family protein [Kribbella sandramycini]
MTPTRYADGVPKLQSRRPLASIYIRLSGAADEANTSREGMEEDARGVVANLGADVYAVHYDDGISGSVRDRPEFLAWLDDARSGTAQILVPYHGDRITREGVNAAAMVLDVIEGKDPATGAVVRPPVRFVSVDDGLDSERDAESFRWRFVIAAEVGRAELHRIKQRALARRRRLRAKGRVQGGRRGWPFRAVPRDDGKGMRYEPIPAHADAIRWTLEHLRAKGTKGDIVREWVRRGLKPKGTKKAEKEGRETYWHMTPITRILSNPNIYGAQMHGDDVIRNEDGTARIDEQQAILTYTEYRELQHLLGLRATRRNRPDPDTEALVDFFYCSSCDRVMYPHRPAAGRTWTYRCRGGVGVCPNPVSVVMTWAEPFVVREFRERLGDLPIDPGGWEPDVYTPDPAVVATLTEAIQAADERLKEDLEDEEALKVVRQRRDLRARLATIQDAAAESSAEAVIQYRETPPGQTYWEAFLAAPTIREKGDLVALAFNGKVTVHPGRPGYWDPKRLVWDGDDD